MNAIAQQLLHPMLHAQYSEPSGKKSLTDARGAGSGPRRGRRRDDAALPSGLGPDRICADRKCPRTLFRGPVHAFTRTSRRSEHGTGLALGTSRS